MGDYFLFSVVCTSQNCFRSFLFGIFVISVLIIKNMDTYHAAPWSSSSSTDDGRYRITHHQRTKQGGNGQQQQRSQDSWTWEEILDGKGPWAQAGEYRRPKAELEAAKAERQWYEEAARLEAQEAAPKISWGEAQGECG